ncbi:MAG TPA: hypothetical protein VFR76_15135, partial [Verrucomicrobiae bacterium]|nr:hypothetical protein [Verrucomicrobiae bacterium]
MNTSCGKRFCAFLFALFCFQQVLSAAGVVTNCDEETLRAAMVGGGTVTFACDGTITLADQLTIDTDTTLDATGHNVVLSGGNAVRLFNINAGTSLTLINLTIANGRNQGVDGAPGAAGGQGSGGAFNVDNATLTLLGCRIWTNTVVGGAGGNGNPEGYGGGGLGGA